MGRIFWRSVGSAWNGTWSVTASAEPLKPPRKEIATTSWVTWPSAAPPSHEGFSINIESEHLELQDLRECPKLDSIPQVWICLCCTIRPVGSTRKTGSGYSQVPHRRMTPKSQSRLRQVFPCPCYFLWISAGMVWMWVWMEDSQIPECL